MRATFAKWQRSDDQRIEAVFSGTAGGWAIVDKEREDAKQQRRKWEREHRPLLDYTFGDLVPHDWQSGRVLCLELVDRLPGESLLEVRTRWPLGEVYETVYTLRARDFVDRKDRELESAWREATREEKRQRKKWDDAGIEYEDPDN